MIRRLREKFDIPFKRVICFIIILFILAGTVQYRLQYRERYNDNSSFQIINFYKEEKDKMEAVFVGSSCTFAFYSPLFAYRNYGIKTTNFSSSGMGMIAYRYAIEEVRKRQKDALIILTITPNYEMQYLGVHFMADYMPLSLNKIRFLTRYFTQPGESILNSLGFYVTLMEFHDRWSEVSLDDLVLDEGIKGATRHKYYLSTVNDIADQHLVTEEKQPMPERMEYYMSDLLDYCDEKNENIVFLLPPKTYTNEEYAQLNSLAELIQNRGYRLLDLRDSFDEYSLNMHQDFYDINHTNIHGSIKYTDKMVQYILNDHECQLGTDAKWDEAWENYEKIIAPHILDVEADMSHRDYDLAAPVLEEVSETAGKITISWNEAEDAYGYRVYRKSDGGFEFIGECDGTSFEDTDIEKGVTYTYTVLSFRKEGNEYRYGNYDYLGKKVEVKP